VLLTGGLGSTSDTGVSNVDGITAAATLVFVGTAPPGLTVQVFAQAQVQSQPLMIGQGVADASGNWQITAEHLVDGPYAISARYSGGASGSVQVTPLSQVVIDSSGPRVTAATYASRTRQVTVTFSDPGWDSLDLNSLATSRFFVARMSKNSPALTLSNFQRVGNTVTFTVVTGRKHPTNIHLQIVSGGVRDMAGNGLDGGFPSSSGHPSDFSYQLPIVLPKGKAGKPRKSARAARA
jgi:hypothetical protein